MLSLTWECLDLPFIHEGWYHWIQNSQLTGLLFNTWNFSGHFLMAPTGQRRHLPSLKLAFSYNQWTTSALVLSAMLSASKTDYAVCVAVNCFVVVLSEVCSFSRIYGFMVFIKIWIFSAFFSYITFSPLSTFDTPVVGILELRYCPNFTEDPFSF